MTNGIDEYILHSEVETGVVDGLPPTVVLSGSDCNLVDFLGVLNRLLVQAVVSVLLAFLAVTGVHVSDLFQRVLQVKYVRNKVL